MKKSSDVEEWTTQETEEQLLQAIQCFIFLFFQLMCLLVSVIFQWTAPKNICINTYKNITGIIFINNKFLIVLFIMLYWSDFKRNEKQAKRLSRYWTSSVDVGTYTTIYGTYTTHGFNIIIENDAFCFCLPSYWVKVCSKTLIDDNYWQKFIASI